MDHAGENTAHLVHGMGVALETATWPAITAHEAGSVLEQFGGAGRLKHVTWHSPRPFSAAALIETDCGHFMLKRHHRALRSPAALAEEHGFMAHLRLAGLAVPEVMITGQGASAVARENGTYELHRKGAGLDLYRDRQSWTPYLSPDHAHAAGAALGRLHLAAVGFQAGSRGPWPLVSSLTILTAREPLAAAESFIAARPALSAFLADKPWRAQLTRLFAALGQGLDDLLTRAPRLWTHNDWHPSNLLWSTDGTVSTVIDFGLAAPTCAAHDLATAIERSAIPWLEPAHQAQPDIDSALALLAGYRTQAPLTDEDLATIIRLLPLVHLEFALSEADYFAGILGDHDQAMLAWQNYLVDHADWFLSRPGQEFLGALATRASG